MLLRKHGSEPSDKEMVPCGENFMHETQDFHHIIARMAKEREFRSSAPQQSYRPHIASTEQA